MEDYLHAKLVWQTFKCKNFRDYHDLYLKSDALLLTDFFETFRETCLSNYGLDAAHYYSAPSMAFCFEDDQSETGPFRQQRDVYFY